MGLFDWLFGKKPERLPKTETPNDRVAALVGPALARANRLIENLRDRGWEMNDGTRLMLASVLEDLTEAAAIEDASAEWKWKTFFNIGQVNLRLLDFQGTVDALTRALQIAEAPKNAWLESSGFWKLSITVNRGVDDRDRARDSLAMGKYGVGDFVGSRVELLKLIGKKGVDPVLKEKAERDLQNVEKRLSEEQQGSSSNKPSPSAAGIEPNSAPAASTPLAGLTLSTSEVLALARKKSLPPAAGSEPSSTPAWRQLITGCPKCGAQFRWLDKGPSEETPFCPNCGYDAVYNGERRAVDPTGRSQPAILPSLPGGIVSCDKCGATNRSTGAPIEQIVQFSLYRCQSCRKTSCASAGCVGFIGFDTPCPHCGKVFNYVSEDYDYV